MYNTTKRIIYVHVFQEIEPGPGNAGNAILGMLGMQSKAQNMVRTKHWMWECQD